MTDDSLTPEAELASAAFDGHVSLQERARFEASADASAQFARFTQLRTELVAVHVPAEGRESAISAALVAFDEMQDPSSNNSSAPAPVISLDERRRRRQYRWLTGAAAAVAVLVVGAAVLNSGGDDNKSSSNFDVAAQNSQNQKSQPVGGPIPQGAPTSGTTAIATPGSTPMAGGINSPAVVTAWALAPSFATAAELASYAADPSFGQSTAASVESGVTTVGGSGATGDKALYNTNCLSDVNTPFAAVVFQGQQVLAIRDATPGQLTVIDPTTCRIVTTIALP